MSKRLMALLLSALMLLSLAGCAQNDGAVTSTNPDTGNNVEIKLSDFKLSAGTAPGPPTYPLAYMAEQNPNITLKPWQSSEQLMSMLSSKEVQLSSCPVSTALVAYNKGLGVQLIDVAVWGMLYVMSSEQDVKSLQDLKGKDVACSGQNGLHDLILRHLLKKNNIDPDKDLNLVYLEMSEASAMLATGQLKYAVLNEPNSSVAALNARKNGVTLTRVVDLTEEWHKLPGQENVRLPMGCLVLVDSSSISPEEIAAFEKYFVEAAEWVNNHPDETGPIVEKHVSWMKGPAVSESIKYARLKPERAADCRAEVEAFFKELSTTTDSKFFGGKLPDDGFYYQP